MNLQSRSASARRQTRRRTAGSVAWTTKLTIFCYLLAMAAMIFGIATYRIRLSREISDLQRASYLATRECKNLELDIQSLKLQRDELTGSAHIRSQIMAYNLPLRSPDATQVRHIAVRYRRNGDNAPARMTAENARKSGDAQLSLVRH